MFALGKMFKYSAWLCSSLMLYHYYLVRNMEKPDEATVKIPFFLEQARRMDWHFHQLFLFFTRPPVTKLLPDRPPAPPGAYPKTLVLSLNGTIISQEYKLGVGFEVKKRPGLSMFINRLSRMYELVIFADQDQGIIMDICEALDPKQMMLPGRFGREMTVLKNGKYIKDLSYLNRPVKEIIYIDFTDESVEYHKDNFIKVSEWDGDMNDRELYDLLPFLENLAMRPNVDVRKEIEKVGREGTGQRYREIMTARRDIIQRQQKSGLTGAWNALGNQKASGPARMSTIQSFENKEK
jgi:import inner membrane translocase subunit TIM50